MIMNEGGGGKKLPTLTNPGTAANLLSGKQLINQNGEIVTGSMTDRGAVTQALNAGGSYAIPAGYHNGAGKVTANSLSSQTSGTATAADIRSGKTAWVNGAKLTGTGQMVSQETAELELTTNSTPLYVSYQTAGLTNWTTAILTEQRTTLTVGLNGWVFAHDDDYRAYFIPDEGCLSVGPGSRPACIEVTSSHASARVGTR